VSGARSTKARPEGTRIEGEAALFRQFQEEAEMLEKEARECPVPKPGGFLGQLLGFRQDGNKQDEVRQESSDSDTAR
jgi:cytochrome c oxidase assembly factor 2